jgi:4'-phosphopantetheinyl transferase
MLTVHLIEWRGEFPDACHAWLTEEEKRRAASFLQQGKGLRWAFFRAALRQILGHELGRDPAGIQLHHGPHGKPQVEGCAFNLSHAGDLALAVISESEPIGIDVEEKCRAARMLRIEEKIAHAQDVLRLPVRPEQRAEALLDLWNAKEAVLKAIGTGLTISPSRVNLSPALDRVERIEGLADLPDLELCKLNLPGFSSHQGFIAGRSRAEPDFQYWTASGRVRMV